MADENLHAKHRARMQERVERDGLDSLAETCRPLHAPSVHFPKFIHFFVKKSTQKIFFVL